MTKHNEKPISIDFICDSCNCWSVDYLFRHAGWNDTIDREFVKRKCIACTLQDMVRSISERKDDIVD